MQFTNIFIPIVQYNIYFIQSRDSTSLFTCKYDCQVTAMNVLEEKKFQRISQKVANSDPAHR